MSAISRFGGEHDNRLWRILHHYVDNAIAAQDLSYVTKINMDETSAKRGHNYITIFMDPEQKNVICATKGRQRSQHGGANARNNWKPTAGKQKTLPRFAWICRQHLSKVQKRTSLKCRLPTLF
ncbi:hypothetical protein XI25_12865 [Paenibacillus sp. DMB20]|nr:hypothetical protein XI25_12865 [Paenibacillus sp. DMB20]